jgi:two-component system, cell cycle sensor histidine kinase and response regulator CckA
MPALSAARRTAAPLRVLLVEDNPADARLVEELLDDARTGKITLIHAQRLGQALALLEQERFHAVLLDLSLPDSVGMETFLTARAAASGAPIIVLTGLLDEELAVRAVREGAQDYLVKGQVDGQLLYQSIRYAIERHRVENQLRSSEEQFRQLAENIKEAFLVVELPTYKMLYVSPMWEQIWGRPIVELHRDPMIWFNAIHEDDRAQVENDRIAIERGQPATSVFRVLRPDKSIRWVRARLFPVFDGGYVYRLVGLVEDITEMRLTEEKFRQAQRMEAVGRLAGGIAHDFNNLLTAILGYADLATDGLDPESPAVACIREISKAGGSAVNLTRQLLAFSRRQILQLKVIDLNQSVQRMDSLLRRLIGEDVTLRMNLGARPATVLADSGQIEQVIMNLAVNARDAMPEGGHLTIETANVELSDDYVVVHPEAAAGHYVMLAVSDSGVGMDEATQRRLFEPFFTTKDPGRGTGLGLATVYGIVKQSQGFVWVYSELAHGSTFKIYLPVATTPIETDHGAPARPARDLTGTETVLVVEDQAEVRSLTRETLQRNGYTVVEASDGAETMERSRQHQGHIHLLFTDVVMRGMSGRRVAQQISAERPEIRVIYTSGYTDDAIVHHGVLEPGLAFLQKPFTTQALLRKVREVLDAERPPAV